MKKIYLLGKEMRLGIDEVEGFQNTCEITSIEGGYIVRRIIKNMSKKTLRLQEIKAMLSGVDFGFNPSEDYYYANENARLFCTLTIPLDYNRLDDNAVENEKFHLQIDRRWCDPKASEGRICSCPYQPFPAILISNYQTEKGIVCGSLSQEVFYHNFEVGHNAEGAYLEIYSSFKATAYREVKPQESIEDIFYLGETAYAGDINKIFEGYTAVLRCYLSGNEGAKETNRHTLIWDSWNDGIYRDVSEEMLVREAKAVKKYFPTVEWFQLDDGYSSYCEADVDLDAHGLGVPYEGAAGVDEIKFPSGLKGYTDKIKAVGLKPSIWIGAWVPMRTKLYQEHPEYFLDYSYRLDRTQPLDVSQAEVRAYMCSALDVFVGEYGFEGIKHDFWSYAFEDRHNLLSNKERSGYEHRSWWHRELRSRLPAWGYLQTGCDVSMGNPFIGKYFNNYRFGLDVGAGNWNNVKTTMHWSVAILSTHTGDLFVPNSDSIGMLPKLTDEDFMFIVNFQIISRSLVEISGRFSFVLKDNRRLQILKRAVSYVNNGENVYFAKYDYRQRGFVLPEIMYINTAFDDGDSDYMTVAIFNSGETKKEVRFTCEDLGLSKEAREIENVWTNAKEYASEMSITLSPHGSALFKIKK